MESATGQDDRAGGEATPTLGVTRPPESNTIQIDPIQYLNTASSATLPDGARPLAAGEVGKRARRSQYKAVEDALRDMPSLLNAFLSMDADAQARTAQLLADRKKGIDVATTFIR